jgi:hypothetical protein
VEVRVFARPATNVQGLEKCLEKEESPLRLIIYLMLLI